MFLTFILPYFETGGILAPAYIALSTHASPSAVHAWGVQHQIFEPFYVRFWQYFSQVIFHFNLGYSWRQTSSVWTIIVDFVPRTIWIALVSLVLSVAIALPLGVVQASKRNTFFDYTVTNIFFVL